MAYPHLEPKGHHIVSLALPVFLPSVISSYYPLDPPQKIVVSDTMLASLATSPDLFGLGSLLLLTGLKREMPQMMSAFKTLQITYCQR